MYHSELWLSLTTYFSSQVRSRLQVSEVKCEKMLIKLKSFKEKNEKLQLALDEGERHADQRVYEARRGVEEQLKSLHTRLRDVETHNGQLIHENNTLKESAAHSSQVSVKLSLWADREEGIN